MSGRRCEKPYKTGKNQGSKQGESRRVGPERKNQRDNAERICEELGTTLSQFFAEDNEKRDLTQEQKSVLETWEGLSDIEKKAVETYVRGMKLE